LLKKWPKSASKKGKWTGLQNGNKSSLYLKKFVHFDGMVNWKKVQKSICQQPKLILQIRVCGFGLDYFINFSGHLDIAYKSYSKAVEFDVTRVKSLYQLGCIHAPKEEKDEAFKYFKMALDAGFSNFQDLRLDSDLDFLRSDPRFEELTR